MTTLQDELVSTEVSRNPTIVYERRNNRKENPNRNKEKDKEKHKKEELPTSYTKKIAFPAALEANTPSPFTKKGVQMDEMELFKQVQINLPSNRFHQTLNFSRIFAHRSIDCKLK